MATSRGANQRDYAGANGWRKSGPGGYNRGDVGIVRRRLSMARICGLFGECTGICTARAASPRVFRELCGGSVPVLSAKSFIAIRLRPRPPCAGRFHERRDKANLASTRIAIT
jgi:hypothetical protein